MNKYAVVRFKGKQYKVSEGDTYYVDKINDHNPEAEILLFVEDGKVKIGKPVVKDVKIKIKVIDEVFKGEKVEVFKYKAKSRYRKKIGFRPQYTKLLIENIA